VRLATYMYHISTVDSPGEIVSLHQKILIGFMPVAYLKITFIHGSIYRYQVVICMMQLLMAFKKIAFAERE